MKYHPLTFSLLFMSALFSACQSEARCSDEIFEGRPYTICKTSTASDLRVFLKDEAGDVFGDFDAINSDLKTSETRLAFAVNGGMYHPNREPVGLYIEEGVEVSKLNTNKGPGNFHLLPNGVFWIGTSSAGVTAADAFSADGVEFATQSGPMLVIENQLHPIFKEKSQSFRIRNGVGVTDEGQVYFVTSDLPVNFHSFARLFKDELKTPNALYLDGTVSKLYSKDLGRNDTGADMGPIIGLVEPISK